MILQVRIPKDLRRRFSDVRILKGLRAWTWAGALRGKRRSSRRDRASRYKNQPLSQSSWRALQSRLPRMWKWNCVNCANSVFDCWWRTFESDERHRL